MGNLKIEFEVPEFENELEIIVTLKKDGKIVKSAVSTPSPVAVTPKPIKESGKKKKEAATSMVSSGNMMEMEF